MTKRLQSFLDRIFRRSYAAGFNVTRDFDASTRRALNAAAEAAYQKHLARLGS
jgi:hypothetical protein